MLSAPTLSILAMLSALLDPTPAPSSAELVRDLERMQQTARVLYVAAHPDDENTQFLGYMANARGWRAAYLSLTRGEGGQNAIGDELVHGLGLIRTWELLIARNTDGAEQWISRQRDFGFSKSAEETLEVWDEAEALGDMVWVIRRFQPHVIVTRFPEQGTTHGHHLASAQLARRAFALAGDASAYPEQLEGDDAVAVWQPERLLYNVPLRWIGGEIQPEWHTVDLGGFDPVLGVSYGELSAASRSLHRSQAFGASARRGVDLEAFELLEGSVPEGEDPFADIPSGWATVAGGAPVAALLEQVHAAFDPRAPADSVPLALEAYEAAASLPAPHADALQAQIGRWIAHAAGVWVDARADRAFVVPGAAVETQVDLVARGQSGWSVVEVEVAGASVGAAQVLERNVPVTLTSTWHVPADAELTTPFWLRRAASTGTYAVPDRAHIGPAIGAPAATARVSLRPPSTNTTVVIEVPVRTVDVDPTLGERVTPVTIVPPLFVSPRTEVVLMPNGAPTSVTVDVEAVVDVEARIALALAPGWRAEPASASVTLVAGERTSLDVEVTPPAGALPAALPIIATVGDRVYGLSHQPIDYPHLPPLGLIQPAVAQLSPLDWTVPTGLVGYIMGPGDAVASSLQAAGVDVQQLDEAAIATGDLSGYRAIVVGVRAFHTSDALRTHADRLWDYAAAGGTVIVQYQTNNRAQPLTQAVGPAPITIGRGRVTVEDAPITWLEGSERVHQGLHALTEADLAGWVQERGLYFAADWDPAWTPLVALADPGEEPERGALLVAEHGEGAVFYVGLSLFRQLPAGVPGAYRLLANLIAYTPNASDSP